MGTSADADHIANVVMGKSVFVVSWRMVQDPANPCEYGVYVHLQAIKDGVAAAPVTEDRYVDIAHLKACVMGSGS